MKHYLLFLVIVMGLASCTQSSKDKDSVARVYDVHLTRQELKAIVPSDLSKADSTLFANNFISLQTFC